MIVSRARSAALWAWLLGSSTLAWVACGGSVSTKPPASAAGALSGATYYHTRAEPGAVLGGRDGEGLARAVKRIATANAMELSGDGRLARLAQRLASAGERDVEPRVLAQLGAELGLVEAHNALRRVERGAGETWLEALAASLPQALLVERPTHFGIYLPQGSRVDAARADRSAVVVLSRRSLWLDPVPRVGRAGRPLRARGQLAPGLRDPRFVLSTRVGQRNLPAGSGPAFDVRLPMPDAGHVRVEVFARDAVKQQRVAVFEVAVEGGLPVDEPPREVVDARVIGARLSRVVRELRGARHVPPLAPHPSLQRLAERCAGKMRDEGFVDREALAADVREIGLDGGLVAVVVLHGTADSLPRQLLDDEVKGRTLGNRALTHVAAAVVGEGGEGGSMTAVLLASRLPKPVRADLAAAELLSALNQHRHARGRPPLRPEPLLSRKASHAAAAFFSEDAPDQDATIAEVHAALERQALRFARIEAVMAVVREPRAAAALEPLLQSDASAVGIGLAQGDRADTGPGAIAVVFVQAWER